MSKSLTVRSKDIESDISVMSTKPEERKPSLQAGVAFLAYDEAETSLAALMGTNPTALLA